MTDEEWNAYWDKYNLIAMIADMRQIFPKSRIMQMFAWIILFGAVGGETRDQSIKRLMKLGFAKSSLYEVDVDIKKFQAYLREKWGREVSQETLAKKVRQVQSEVAELVVN